MSILKADLLQNRAGTRPPGVTAGDFVKATAKANNISATPVISASLNISSFVDASVGTIDLNLTLPMVSIDYITPASARSTAVANQFVSCNANSASQIEASVFSNTAITTAADSSFISVSVFGALA